MSAAKRTAVQAALLALNDLDLGANIDAALGAGKHRQGIPCKPSEFKVRMEALIAGLSLSDIVAERSVLWASREIAVLGARVRRMLDSHPGRSADRGERGAEWSQWARETLHRCTRNDAETNALIDKMSTDGLMALVTRVVQGTDVSLLALPNGEGVGIFRRM